jgi:hypothetical protein
LGEGSWILRETWEETEKKGFLKIWEMWACLNEKQMKTGKGKNREKEDNC